MVYFRAYRPQKVSELDKESVRATLQSLFSQSEIPHSYLLIGPRGTGKTSAGRIIAKLVNCDRIKNNYSELHRNSIMFEEPCGACESCELIKQGNHPDVLEIDAASNTGVDNIRELRDAVRFSPVMGGKKVYVIDEVHMLSKGAFNALLKTLEEPPVHVIFVLATTELSKLPDTIRSRCIELTFSKATHLELTNSLKRIVKGEKLSIDEKSLSVIAEYSDGSFRDAAKILEQAVKTENATPEKIRNMLGVSNLDTEELLELIFRRDLEGAIVFIEKKSNDGADHLLFIQAVLEKLHEYLMFFYTKKESNKHLYKEQDIIKLANLLLIAYRETKGAALSFLPLEVSIITFCSDFQEEVE
jgi:DNA polymerase-3 subunit gamma/tau